jgi:hypothetical protein
VCACPNLTALIDATARADPAPGLARAIAPHAAEVVAAFAEHADPELIGATAACGARTLRLAAVEPRGRADGYLRTRCERDWILWLRAGEVPAPELLAALPELLADRAVTHYRLPLPDGGSAPRLLRNEPPALRLGTAADPEALGPHRSLPHGLLPAPAAAAPPSRPLSPALVGHEEIDAHWPLRALPAEGYAARLELAERDLRFDAGGGRVVHVAVENRSPVPWLWGSRLNVSYRWHPRAALGEGLRTPLPGPLAPGERTVVPVSIEAPAAGSYVLELDIVDEGVTWFEQPLRVPVAVA